MRALDTTKEAALDSTRASNIVSHNHYDTEIRQEARLNITMTIESKSRKKTVYRVAQRPDGVIVEKPRYRPSPPISICKTRGEAEDKGKEAVNKDGRDGFGEAVERGRSGYNKGGKDSNGQVFERGRSGYNNVFTIHTTQIDGHQGDIKYRVPESNIADPMQRFLAESGPWSTFNTRSASFGGF
jgi:hypothetical protein